MLIGAGALAVVSSSGTYWVTSRGYKTEISQMKAESATAALKDFQKDFGIIHDAAVAYQANQNALATKFSTIQEAFNAAVKAHPLPSTCKPDAARMRALSDAIAAIGSVSRSGLPSPLKPSRR